MCDIVTSQIRAGLVKMNEPKHDDHEDTEKKVVSVKCGIDGGEERMEKCG